MLVLSGLLLVTAAVVTPGGAASQSNGSPETRPGALWEAFPLRVTPTRASVRRAARPRVTDPVVALPFPTVPAVVREDPPSGVGPYTIVAMTLVLAGAAVGAFLSLRGPAGRWSTAVRAARAHSLRPAFRSGLAHAPKRSVEQEYILHVPGRMGFGDRVVERTGVPPVPGEVIVDQELGVGEIYVVKSIGRSPIPGDTRRCAVLRIV